MYFRRLAYPTIYIRTAASTQWVNMKVLLMPTEKISHRAEHKIGIYCRNHPQKQLKRRQRIKAKKKKKSVERTPY